MENRQPCYTYGSMDIRLASLIFTVLGSVLSCSFMFRILSPSLVLRRSRQR